mmetsp:Transcript_6179/g.14316  ORF Transcript_6179/g.14316 Transcript_6179/m.14316 type:complete len:695 (+) Transcript_6179:70-2154(+)
MSRESDIIDDENDMYEHVGLFQDSTDWDLPVTPSSLSRGQEKTEERPVLTPSSSKTLYLEMPPQLHPACSIGIQKVSSCYFSLASANNHESMSDLLSQLGDTTHETKVEEKTNEKENFLIDNSEDIFYHDVLMQVFTFLDAKSLLCFSETARRSNFEVFYFLQLQLQQSLLLDNSYANTSSAINSIEKKEIEVTHDLSTIEGSVSLLSRAATLDMGKARELVEQYQASNSTLRTMPLSYSLAYVRQYLLRSGFHNMFSNHNDHDDTSSDNGSKMAQKSQTLTSAAVFMTVVGAASLVSSSDASAITIMTDRFGSELQNVLLRVGIVGSLMRAVSDTEHGAAMREKAEQLARSMQSMPITLMPARRNEQQQRSQQKQESEEVTNQETKSESRTQQMMNFELPSLFKMRHMLQEMMSSTNAVDKQQEPQPMLFDPYDHLPSEAGTDKKVSGEKKGRDGEENDNQLSSEQANGTIYSTSNSTVDRKMPSGCVGAYSRAIHKAADFITEHTREKRKSAFQALSPESQRFQSLLLLSACTSNDTLDNVKAMISSIDVDQFYVGNDGTETCALHTAAFNGADKVVEFLCAGIDHQDSRLDGGLCDVNAKDNNGWTALHFAAGSNSVAAVRVLAHHGAILNVEAHNGYTPLGWAIRLSNNGVAKELDDFINSVYTDQSSTWISTQPLVSIANRFFSLIPTQ